MPSRANPHPLFIKSCFYQVTNFKTIENKINHEVGKQGKQAIIVNEKKKRTKDEKIKHS